MARRRNKGEERALATARVRNLVVMAQQEAVGPDADLAPRYVVMARRLAMKYQMSLPNSAKASVCRGCSNIRSAANSRTRLRAGRLVTTCLKCARVQRRPIRKAPAAAASADLPNTPQSESS